MKNFKFTIEDEMFGQLSGQTEARNEHEARKEVKEWYAQELGMMAEEIEIVSIFEVK